MTHLRITAHLAVLGAITLAAGCTSGGEDTSEPRARTNVVPPPPTATAQTAAEPVIPDRGDLGWRDYREEVWEAEQWRAQYPEWAYRQVAGTETERAFDLREAANPFLLNGDFDGDGRLDVAAWVERRGAPDQVAVVVVHRAGGVYVVDPQSPNWEVFTESDARQDAEEAAGEGLLPAFVGDALLFEQPESAGELWYWSGSEYLRLQYGD